MKLELMYPPHDVVMSEKKNTLRYFLTAFICCSVIPLQFLIAKRMIVESFSSYIERYRAFLQVAVPMMDEKQDQVEDIQVGGIIF